MKAFDKDRFWRSVVKEAQKISEHPGYRYVYFNSFSEVDQFFTDMIGADWEREPWVQFLYDSTAFDAINVFSAVGAGSSGSDIFGAYESVLAPPKRVAKSRARNTVKRREVRIAAELIRAHEGTDVSILHRKLQESGIDVSMRTMYYLRNKIIKGV